MRVALLSVLFVVFAPGLSFGQATTSNCPTIEIIGPAGVTNPDDEMTFVANLSVAGRAITYQWVVEEGTITDGQGTAIVKVKGVTDGVTIKATVTIGGLPEGCKNDASEAGPVAQRLPLESVDEWGIKNDNEIRARLDSYFTELAINPGQVGVLVLYVTKTERINPRNKRLRLVVDHAKFRKFDLERLQFLLYPSEIVQTTVYRIYKGFDFPCDGCIAISGRDLK